MSTSLVWRPIADAHSLPDELKYVLRKKGLPRVFTSSDYDYVHGLVDAGVKGADELLELLNQHGEIELLEMS